MLRKNNPRSIETKKQKSARPAEYKSISLPGATKIVDEEQGIVEHIITVFGVADKGMPPDISHPGSFTKTIQERGEQVLVLDQHRTDSVLNILGRPLKLEEIGRNELPADVLQEFPEATGGLKATTQFFMDTPEGEGAFKRIRNGGLREWSYGYDALDTDMSTEEVGGKKVRCRNLRTLRLYEYSPVLWGMAESRTLSAKSDDGVNTPPPLTLPEYADLPLAKSNRPWDAGAARQRVEKWAAGDWAKYGQAFLACKVDDPETADSYQYQFADVINTQLVAVPKAIFSLAHPTKGIDPGELPDADAQQLIKDHLALYYAKMQAEFEDETILPPWEQDLPKEFWEDLPADAGPGDPQWKSALAAQTTPEETPAADKADKQETKGASVSICYYLHGCLNTAFTMYTDTWLKQGYIAAMDDYMALGLLFRTAMDNFHAAVPLDVADITISPNDHEYYGSDYYIYDNRSQGYDMANFLQAVLAGAAHTLLDKWFRYGIIPNRDDYTLLNTLLNESLDEIEAGFPDALRLVSVSTKQQGDMPGVQTKAGRILSARNAAKIVEALTTQEAALAMLRDLLEAAGVTGSADDDDDDEAGEEKREQPVTSAKTEADDPLTSSEADGAGDPTTPTLPEAEPDHAPSTSPLLLDIEKLKVEIEEV